jgi:hypothetical protein
MKNCVDIVRPFSEAISERDDVQVIGGIGSAALADRSTVIIPNEKRLVAPPEIFLSQYRDDGNLRDFDALVLTTDGSLLREVEADGAATIGSQLELSFFDLKPAARLDNHKQHPIKSLGQFVADRYVSQAETGEISSAQKSLFPFALPMDLETLETWRLFIGEKDPYPLPIPHPASTVLNYLTRSVSGLRPKDTPKINALVKNILNKSPAMLDWIMDGPGESQIELAKIFQTLRSSGSLAVGEAIVIDPYTESLRTHRGFMIPEAPAAVQSTVMGTTYAKSRALFAVESNPRVVTFWQRVGEKRAGKITHNE